MRRMLAKKPAERPESMDEVVDVIRSSKIFRTVPQPPKPTVAAEAIIEQVTAILRLFLACEQISPATRLASLPRS